MNLYDQMKHDLQKAILNNNKELVSILRTIIGEFNRQKNKKLNDEQILSVLRILIREQRELLADTKSNQESTRLMDIIFSYIGIEPTEEDIINYIRTNIDFSSLKNKGMAIGIVKKHYKYNVDGDLIKKIINTNF